MRNDTLTLDRPWAVKNLGAVADVEVGGTPSTVVSTFWNGEIPWMVSGDIHQRRIIDVLGRITEAGLRSSNAKIIAAPAVAIALAGQGKTRGTVALTLKPLCTNQSVALIRAHEDALETRYLFHNLDARYEELRARSAGGGRAGLSKAIIDAIPLTIPPLIEQRRIAEILDTVDATIQHTEALIAKLKQMKAGLLHDLLTRGLDEHGQLRDPVAHPEQFKDSSLGGIPKEWEIQPLVDFAPKRADTFVNGPFGSNLLARELIDEGVPIIYVRDIKPGRYERVSTVCVTAEKADILQSCNVQCGDVLVAKVGDPPCDAAPYLLAESSIVTQDVIRIRPNEDVDTRFLSNLLNSELGRRAVEPIIIAGTRKRVSLTEFKHIQMPKPSLEEQRKIVSTLDAHDARIHAEEAYRDKLKQLKQGLMDDLLTGRVRVQVKAEE
jgi:type I restriction enzyme, S subunit